MNNRQLFALLEKKSSFAHIYRFIWFHKFLDDVMFIGQKNFFYSYSNTWSPFQLDGMLRTPKTAGNVSNFPLLTKLPVSYIFTAPVYWWGGGGGVPNEIKHFICERTEMTFNSTGFLLVKGGRGWVLAGSDLDSGVKASAVRPVALMFTRGVICRGDN